MGPLREFVPRTPTDAVDYEAIRQEVARELVLDGGGRLLGADLTQG